VPNLILSSTCLQYLDLYQITSLIAFPTDGLPISLQSLSIRMCAKLSFMPLETWSNYKSLVNLWLRSSCDSLTSFPLDGFPMLQTLDIRDCRCLGSIFILEIPSRRSSSLQSPKIKSHKSIGLFKVKLKMDRLTDLEQLTMNCGELSFCPKLQSIEISSQRTTPSVTEWGLQGLTTLSRLVIEKDGDIVNTLVKELLLPISLVSLNIGDLYNTKTFDGNGLQHLSSLENLHFRNCQQLESLPENCLPSSLKSLEIWSCERLESLPEDCLPDSLKRLSIVFCPLLEERYKMKEHWSKISLIPVIEIDGQVTI
jgi:hypothetical protein